MRISINANRGFYFAFIAILMVSILLLPLTHSGDGWGYAADTLEFEESFGSMYHPTTYFTCPGAHCGYH